MRGLAGGKYLDNLAGYKECAEAEAEVVFRGEVDRVYVAAPDVIKVRGEAMGS